MLTEEDKQEMEKFCCTWGVGGATAKPMIRKLLTEVERLEEELESREGELENDRRHEEQWGAMTGAQREQAIQFAMRNPG